jgi:hypothetical protein
LAPNQDHRTRLGPRDRAGAAILAVLWLAGGVSAVFLGFTRHLRLGVLLGPLAIIYGFLWVRVAWTGRRLEWPANRR